MSGDHQDSFYIGYLTSAPPLIAKFLRPRLIAIFLIILSVSAVLVTSQGYFATAFFEYGNEREFEGVISEYPYPTLLVARPGNTEGSPYSRYLLTVFGKHGADEAVAGMHGAKIRVDGTLIYRDDQTMIEILPDSISLLADPAALEPPESIGRFTLRGEIVDSKCYLGVMKPGHLKPHRGCAIRCISGGIPPIFVVHDEKGDAGYYLLSGSDGRALNKEVLDMIAEPLEIEGEILRMGSDLILRTEPQGFRRIESG